MNPATTVGRHQLSPRFTALVRTAYIGYPPVAQLQTVYGSMLEQVLRKVTVGLPKPLSSSSWPWSPASSKNHLLVQIKARILMQASASAVGEYISPHCLSGASTTTDMGLGEAPSVAEADV